MPAAENDIHACSDTFFHSPFKSKAKAKSPTRTDDEAKVDQPPKEEAGAIAANLNADPAAVSEEVTGPVAVHAGELAVQGAGALPGTGAGNGDDRWTSYVEADEAKRTAIEKLSDEEVERILADDPTDGAVEAEGGDADGRGVKRLIGGDTGGDEEEVPAVTGASGTDGMDTTPAEANPEAPADKESLRGPDYQMLSEEGIEEFGGDWDDAVDQRSFQGGKAVAFPVERDLSKIDGRTFFFSTARNSFCGQTHDGVHVAIPEAPPLSAARGLAGAKRYERWLELATFSKASLEEERNDIEKGIADMISYFEEVDASTTLGRKNDLAHWVALAKEINKQKRREFQAKNLEAKELEEANRRRKEQLGARNAPLKPQPKKQRKMPAFMAVVQPFADELADAETSEAHHAPDLKRLRAVKGFKNPVKGEADKWMARLSRPIESSSCCRLCGEDNHQEAATTCAVSSAADVKRPKIKHELIAQATEEEGDDNVFLVRQTMRHREQSVAVCAYPLCGESRGHLIKACPHLHARCSDCGYRGHREGATFEGQKVCPAAPAAERHLRYRSVGLLGNCFEEFAGEGRYTRMRYGFAAAGFYGCAGPVEEAILDAVSYDVVTRVGGFKVAQYLEDCRSAAHRAFSGSLVKDVVGTHFVRSAKEERKAYDDHVKACAVAYLGVQDHRRRIADVKAEVVAALVELQKQPRKKADEAELLALNVTKERDDIHGAVVDLIQHLSDPARVYTGAEPAGEETALRLISPAAVRIYNEIKQARAGVGIKSSLRQEVKQSEVTSAADAVKSGLMPMAPPAVPPASVSKRGVAFGHRRTLSSGSSGSSSGNPRKRAAYQRDSDAIRRAFAAHQEHERKRSKVPDVVEGVISTSKYKNLTKAAYKLLECTIDGQYYDERDSLPRLTSIDLEALPECAVHVPTMDDEVWADSPLRKSDAVWLLRRFWYIYDVAANIYVFDPDHRHLPAGMRQSSRHHFKTSRPSFKR